MRAVLCAAAFVFAAGCAEREKTVAGSGGDPKPVEKAEGKDSLPKATSKLRTTSVDLYRFYRDKADEKYPHEGKRIVMEIPLWSCSESQAEKKPALLQDDQKGLRRPTIVYLLREPRSPKQGEFQDNYIEGVLRGTVEFAAKPWAKEWLNRSNGALKDRFILIEDVQFVAAPNG